MSDDRLFPDAAVVRALLRDRHPRWAGLPLRPVLPGGWDNRTFRLGDDLAVRLPSAERYAAQPAKEHVWLPRLAPALPLPIPRSLALGTPGVGFPFPWSVRRWLPGAPAEGDALAHSVAFAEDLAAFLGALQRIDPAGGPPPGAHNHRRGDAPAALDAEMRALLPTSPEPVAAAALWEDALAAPPPERPVWVHGDLAPSNLIVREGRLAAVIDFGLCAVGDPACDLVIAWTFLARRPRAAFRRALALDDATWVRARGWALWKALLVRAGHAPRPPAERSADRVLALLLSGD